LELSRADWLKFYDVSLGEVTHFVKQSPPSQKDGTNRNSTPTGTESIG
jgi:hypothetical protein